MNNRTMNENFSRDLEYMLHAAKNPGLRTGFTNQMQTSLSIDVDPHTGLQTVTLFSEDGRGNGVGLFCVPLDKFQSFITAHENDVQRLQEG